MQNFSYIVPTFQGTIIFGKNGLAGVSDESGLSLVLIHSLFLPRRYEIRDPNLVEESVLETLKVKADFHNFKPRPFNMFEFYDRTGHDIKDMLLACQYRGMQCAAENFHVVSPAAPASIPGLHPRPISMGCCLSPSIVRFTLCWNCACG